MELALFIGAYFDMSIRVFLTLFSGKPCFFLNYFINSWVEIPTGVISSPAILSGNLRSPDFIGLLVGEPLGKLVVEVIPMVVYCLCIFLLSFLFI
jgi:hypothetical protein